MAEKEIIRRPRMRSWEADEDVARLMDLCLSTTGASLKEIVNEALRVQGPVIVRRLLLEREGAKKELETLLATNNPNHHKAELRKRKNP
ncbi:MAG: hypothetical protein WCR20_05165 [Verrucomicrobiota bacterium]|jgi:hypothetical protein|nr:hypothetical protein [Verrucomicrobiota bacterium]